MSAHAFFITVIPFSYLSIQACSHHNSFILWYLFHCLIYVQPECFLFFMCAPHLRHIRTDKIQQNTMKFHLQAYYPVCYPPQFHYPLHMLLFQYDSHTIIFVSASTVLHFISSTYASCFHPLPASFLHTQYVQLSSLHKVRHFSSFTGHGFNV